MVRLKDIALRAGVSVMTVSKVLRDAHDISPATKARVKLLAQQMGYVPDSMAQGLRTRTTHLLGLVVSAVTNPIFARAILAIEEQAHALGYDLVLAHTMNDEEREATVIRRLLSRRVDGLIISPVYRLSPNAAVYNELLASRTPVVLLGQKAAFCDGLPTVETDDLAASQALTAYLISLGHRRIAFFAGSGVGPWAHERLEGYRRALREAHLEPDESRVFTAGTRLEDGEKAALQMLSEKVNVTAIQASNDLVAIGAMSVLRKQGVAIPQQISVAGFGNVLLSEHCAVPLTTMGQPKYRLGAAAMELMRKLLKGESVESKRIEAELIIRQSTARRH